MPLRNWAEMLDEAAKAAPTEYKVLDPGVYDMFVEKAEHRTSQSGKDGYNIHAKVESGPHQGQRVFETFYVSPESPQAMSIFFRQMGVLGLDRNFWASDPTDDQICGALVGKRFRGTVGKELYNGKEQNRLKNVATPGPAPVGAGGPPVPGAGPTPPVAPTPTPTPPAAAPQAAAPTPPAAAPAPTPAAAPAPAAPAAPANPWDSAPAAPAAANDPWAATPPPAPPVPGA